MSVLQLLKTQITAVKAVAGILKTSLGPKGMDKMLVRSDNDILITTDGATILDHLEVEHPTIRLMTEIAQTQDRIMGDGTTGVVLLVASLLKQSEKLLDKHLHPLILTRGLDLACNLAIDHLRTISEEIDLTNNRDTTEFLKNAAKSALSSKIANRHLDKIAEVCVDAVIAVANLEDRQVELEWIKLDTRVGGTVQDIQLIHGIALHNTFSHPQMRKEVYNPKICMLSSIEFPKPRHRCFPVIQTLADWQRMQALDEKYYIDSTINKIVETGAEVVLCQYGFDDKINDLLHQHGINVVRWCFDNTARIAVATNSTIAQRCAELPQAKLGTAKVIREIQCGTTEDKMIVLEGCANSKAVTIVVSGSNRIVVEEIKRSIHDALCVLRNLIRDSRVVYGGGSSEVACSLHLLESQVSGREQLVVRAFSEALNTIPLTLAENCGWDARKALAEITSRQLEEKNFRLGIDCNEAGNMDMKSQGVFDPLASKIQQLNLATDVAKMVLRVDYFIRARDDTTGLTPSTCSL